MPCYDCKLNVSLKACAAHNPLDAQICKDCCVKRSGHKCKQWDLCWPPRHG